MTTKLFVVKYIADLRRWEPRNVGVIAVNSGSTASRFLGEQESTDFKVDLRRARKVVTGDRANYQEWVHYWKRTLAETDGLETVLRHTKDNYWITEAAEVQFGETCVTDLVNTYFPQLVVPDEDDDEDAIALEPTVDDLLREAGLLERKEFQKDVPIQAEIPHRKVYYRFHYYWDNGQTIVGQRVSFKKAEHVQSMAWRFDHVPSGITTVAFVTSEDTQPELQAELDASRVDEAIDVSDEGALERVVSLFQ